MTKEFHYEKNTFSFSFHKFLGFIFRPLTIFDHFFQLNSVGKKTENKFVFSFLDNCLLTNHSRMSSKDKNSRSPAVRRFGPGSLNFVFHRSFVRKFENFSSSRRSR